MLIIALNALTLGQVCEMYGIHIALYVATCRKKELNITWWQEVYHIRSCFNHTVSTNPYY